ncbi:Tigger transposable element-derived protein 2, partial [Araneus ventricosus]
SPSATAIPTAGSADMPISYLTPIPFLTEIPFYYPPLPEIPIVSKTICLSIGYFLPDSEALAIPKCRTFIYAMDPTKRKRVLLTVKHKFQIVSRIEAGEKLSSDIEVGNSFIAELQELIVKGKLTADQIHNCDETGIYWRALPTKTLAAEYEAVAPGRKMMKDRVTILGCANTSGSHRAKLTLVGKSKKPRCFKGINKTALPVHYMHQEST